jgi:hypothetical protein
VLDQPGFLDTLSYGPLRVDMARDWGWGIARLRWEGVNLVHEPPGAALQFTGWAKHAAWGCEPAHHVPFNPTEMGGAGADYGDTTLWLGSPVRKSRRHRWSRLTELYPLNFNHSGYGQGDAVEVSKALFLRTTTVGHHTVRMALRVQAPARSPIPEYDGVAARTYAVGPWLYAGAFGDLEVEGSVDIELVDLPTGLVVQLAVPRPPPWDKSWVKSHPVDQMVMVSSKNDHWALGMFTDRAPFRLGITPRCGGYVPPTPDSPCLGDQMLVVNFWDTVQPGINRWGDRWVAWLIVGTRDEVIDLGLRTWKRGGFAEPHKKHEVHCKCD